MKPLNLFYSEPDPDRWVPFDRYPRRIIRRIVRGKSRPGGVMMIALSLMKGLDKLGVGYRFNDYKYIKNHPDEIACIIGKPQVLYNKKWKNPVILGAGIFSHPVDCPDLFKKYAQVKRVLVPGPWIRDMFIPYYGEQNVIAWPAGIDTNEWSPEIKKQPVTDFLIYDKVRWDHDKYQEELINPVIDILTKHSLSYTIIRYGNYTHHELLTKLSTAKAVIFLCEHETQGQAYQQILSTGTPILAWDRGGNWQDPAYYPHKVSYQPVSSVPYWDDRCGTKFTNTGDFELKLNEFINNLNKFKPRDYVLENFTLEISARKYIEIHQQVERELI